MIILGKCRQEEIAPRHEEDGEARAIRDHRLNYIVVNCDECGEEPDNENGYRLDWGIHIANAAIR